MKRLLLVAMSSVVFGCAGHAQVWVAAPPPPPPPPPATFVVDAQPATVQVSVAPAPSVEAEEVIATSEPPEPIYEEQDDMPAQGMFWVPGYWQWTGADWAWYYGHWDTAPDGRIYIAPYYERVDDHVVYVRGYWGLQGEEPRYYGGDRIVFVAAARPDGYVRGSHVIVARSGGLPPGQRVGHYGASLTVKVKKRPLPTATAPREAVAQGSLHAEGHVESHVQGQAEGGHSQPEPGAKPAPAANPEPTAHPEPAARAQPKPAPQPQAKPAPKPRRK
jgi:hypothetical protein